MQTSSLLFIFEILESFEKINYGKKLGITDSMLIMLLGMIVEDFLTLKSFL